MDVNGNKIQRSKHALIKFSILNWLVDAKAIAFIMHVVNRIILNMKILMMAIETR